MNCSVPDCVKPRGDRSVCYMHAGRWRKYGSYDKPGRSWQERFWSFVAKSNGCWLWTGAADRRGYGLLGGNAPMRAAHRLSYLIAYGDPSDRHVCHRCDNPPCVRPDHLFLGDDAVNLADMVRKKRSSWGEAHAKHKLTEDQVRAIRSAVVAGRRRAELAVEFGVSHSTIDDIAIRRSWYHLD